jgi:hypothetical protein
MRERCAFVLVTHSMADVKLFCSKAVVLRKGKIAFSGEPEEAITFYEAQKDTPVASEAARRAAILAPDFKNDAVLQDVSHYWCDEAGTPITEIRAGERLHFKVAFRSTITTRNLVLGVPVWSEQGVYATGFSTEQCDGKFGVRKGEDAEFILNIPDLNLNPGTYISNMSISDGVEFLYRQPNSPLTVLPARQRNFGVFFHPHRWSQVR